jgi:cytidylate kinase
LSDPALFAVVAIDGPAASGKSSVARRLARRLNFSHVNSGAFYRAVAWFVADHQIVPDDTELVIREIQQARFRFGLQNGESFVRINEVDPEPYLKQVVVNQTVSQVSSISGVRSFLLDHLRGFGGLDNIVMEGRDIGSVVFPETPYKFYIDASPDVRAQRRAAQGFQDDLAFRDRVDSSRRAAPLIIADDAEVIDSSHLTIDGVVGEIIGRLKKKELAAAKRLE